MALHEEQSPQEKINWQLHLARQRLDISESVEQSLADSSSLDVWSDDEQQYVPFDPTQSRADLVPPRLSLQSKVQPSVRPESFVQSATAEIAAQQKSAKKQEGQNKPQNQNILARLAQRFTSSIAAIMQPEDIAWEPSQSETNQSVPPEHRLTPLPPPYQPRPDNTTRVIDAIPAPSSLTPSLLPTVKSKHLLAGHTGKVRLQTTEIPTVPEKPYTSDSDIYALNRETKEPLREPLTVNVRLREKAQEASPTPQPPLPEPSPTPQPVAGSIARETPLPEKSLVQSVITPLQEKGAATYFGTGIFERGQGDLMVRNERVTETGVVHVTLTSNPGPTLIQYISLHPEVGFTLHLTAPVEIRTTFNYILFTDGFLPEQ